MKRVLIFGAGERGKKVVDENLIYSRHNKILAMIDNNPMFSDYKGIPIISPDEINSYRYDEIWICTIYYEEIRKQLIETCGINEKVIVYIEPIMHILEERIREKYSDTKDCNISNELAGILEYMKGNRVRMYCYPFFDEYLNKKTQIQFDRAKAMYYGIYDGKKMYLSKRLNTPQKAQTYFNAVTMEQDSRSPHCYWNNEKLCHASGVGVDVGAAEGIFALKIIEQVEHIYLIEADEQWVEALNCTFEPYKDKISIIRKFAGNEDSEDCAKLDTILDTAKIDFLKMDIEGMELEALMGAEKTILNNRVELAVCAYHHKRDNALISKWLEERGYQTGNSLGLVVCQGDWELENDETDFRKALIFANNSRRDFPQLGFGMLRLPLENNQINAVKTEKIIKEYMSGEGLKYFDTHPGYINGKSQEIIREFVVKRYPRDSFLIADKMPYCGMAGLEDYEHIFAEELEACGVTYFDYYMLHALTKETYEMHERLGGFSFLERKKQEGGVRHIGISFHDRPELLEQILKKYPEIEFVQLQINYLDWNSSAICSRENYEIARKYEKQIIVMEPIKGGTLCNPIHMDGEGGFKRSELARYALSFVARLPGIFVILSGMVELKHIVENRNTLATVDMQETEKDIKLYKQLAAAINNDRKIQCTGCQYCMRECPAHIPIPDILSLLNVCHNTGVLYNGYVYQKGKASDCIKCGKCEARCPQKLLIRSYMKQAARLFEYAVKSKNYYTGLLEELEKRKNISGNSIKEPLRFAQSETKRKIVLWGTGYCFRTNLAKVEKYCRVTYVCDNDQRKWQEEIASGILCISPKELTELKDIFVIIMMEDPRVAVLVANQLLDMGISEFDYIYNWLDYVDEKWFE